jgi:hypothetical protein
MNHLKKKIHLNVDVKKCGSNFAKCTICESLKDLISKVGQNNASDPICMIHDKMNHSKIVSSKTCCEKQNGFRFGSTPIHFD